MILAPFHVDVGLVNEKDGVPLLRAREIVIEILLRLRRHSADITYGQGEERTLGVFGNAFYSNQYTSAGDGGKNTRCVCFADTRLAVQQEDFAFAFPGYEVGYPGFVGPSTVRVGFILVVLCQCFDQSPSLVFHD